jgi:putative addiction module killer protein
MVEVRQTAAFSKFMAGLRDQYTRAKIAAWIDRLAFGNAGDMKRVGEEVSELRVDYGPATASTLFSVARS